MALPNRSWALTVTGKASPAVALAGTLILNEASAAGLTVRGALIPWASPIVAFRVSVPAVVRTTEAVPVPLTTATVEGVTCWPVPVVSVTAPPVLLPKASLAVMVTRIGVPAVVLLGLLTVITAGAPGVTTRE